MEEVWFWAGQESDFVMNDKWSERCHMV